MRRLIQPQRLYFIICIALLIAAVGCSDKALTTVAKASRDVAAANLAIENTVLSANQTGTLTDAQARPFIELHLKIGQAGLLVDKAVAGLNALAPADKAKILAILQPLIDSVNQAATTGVIPITNQTVKTEILAALTTIQAALATAKAVLG